MKRLVIIIVLVTIGMQSFGQDVAWDKKNFPSQKDAFKAANKEWERGNELFEFGRGQYKNALKHYRKALDFNPKSALLNYRMGICIIQTIHKVESVDYFEKAYKLNPKVSEDIEYELAYAHHLNEDWDIAIKWYKAYEMKLQKGRTKKNRDEVDQAMERYDKRIEECKIGKQYSSKPMRVFIDNIGPVINTEYAEHGVVIRADNKEMFFTSRRPGSTGFETLSSKDIKKEHEEVEYYEDIYRTSGDGFGNWSTPANVGSPVNTKGHDATVSLSPDGQSMIVYSANDEDGGLYESHLDGDKWSKPKRLAKTMDTKYHESSASYTHDRKTIFFVSSKPEDNLGGLDTYKGDGQFTHDIFYCKWDEKKKKWGDPINAGPVVNTKYNERGVFMHPDGKSLYFSSEGHQSMGSYDIFKTEFNSETYTFSEPVNLGYPVNGADADIFFVLSADGKKGYYASVHSDGYGEQDIYVITFLGPEKQVIGSSEDQLLANALVPVEEKIVEPPVEVVSAQTTILKGVVLDALTLKPLLSDIVLTDNHKNKEVARFQSNSATGNFLLSLPSGRDYGIAVEAEGYLFHSENFNIPETQGYQEIYKEIKLKNVAVGNTIVLKNIFFDFAKATLRDESIPELQRLIDLLNSVPSMKIEIAGHTDNKGSDSYNQNLSENRAHAVVDYLVAKGIAKKRLEFKGYGESSPIATNDTDEGRQQNRRTEFKILSK